MPNLIEVVLMMQGVQKFVAGAEEASAAVGKVGTSAEESGTKATAGWKGMVKYAAGMAAVYGAAKFISSAVDQTESLAKSTYALQTATKMDAGTASEWIGLTKQRGISAKQFEVGLVKLSRTMEASRTGTLKESQTVAALREQIDQVAAAGGKTAPAQLAKLSNAIASAQAAGTKARATLAELGVPLADLEKGNTEQTLLRVADAFQKMQNPAQRAALAQQLFGRSGVQMLPVLAQGRAGIEKLLAEQKAQGNYLTQKGVSSTLAMVQQQRKLEDAFNGIRISLGQSLLPVLVTLGNLLLTVLKTIQPLTSNAKALRIVIFAVVGGLIAWKVATMALTVQQLIATAATEGWTTAQWALNIALDANVIGLVVIAVAALVAGFVVAYEKVGWFRDLVNATWHDLLSGAKTAWNWLKSNWPLLIAILTGPFGVVALEIVKNFATIKQAALTVVAAIKKAINDLLGWVASLPNKIGHTLSKIPGVSLAKKGLGAIGLAEGGIVRQAGGFLVGERGPELITLPSGAAVTPLPEPAAFTLSGAGGRPIHLTSQLVVDRKVLAQAVATYTSNQLARA